MRDHAVVIPITGPSPKMARILRPNGSGCLLDDLSVSILIGKQFRVFDNCRTMLALESRQAVRMLHQDALHFLNRFRIALHRMRRMDDLLRCDAVDMRARIFYHPVSSIRRRAPPSTPTMEWATTPSAIGIADKPRMKRLVGFMFSMLVGMPAMGPTHNPLLFSVNNIYT